MTRLSSAIAALIVAALGTAACNSSANLDKAPIGSTVEVTRHDGGVVRGKLAARDESSVRVESASNARSIPRTEIDSMEVVDGTKAPALPAAAKFREYTLPAGTKFSAEIQTPIASESSRVNDPVEATLTQAVEVEGVEVLPVGSVIKGNVTLAEPSGKVKGRATLAAEFTSLSPAGRNDSYPMSASIRHTAAATKGDDAKKIGIPAAGGALIGALVGGKKGALIGAAVGGGGGAAVVLSTSGPEVHYQKGAIVPLSLEQAIHVRVPIRK